jgi:hypothetical protein
LLTYALDEQALKKRKRGQSKISLTFGSHPFLEAVSTATYLNKQGVSSA